MYHIREREDDIRRAAYYGRLKEAESIIAEAPKKYREWLARLAWELPSDHNQTIKLICDIVNSERPDEIEVINDGKTLFMWWD